MGHNLRGVLGRAAEQASCGFLCVCCSSHHYCGRCDLFYCCCMWRFEQHSELASTNSQDSALLKPQYQWCDGSKSGLNRACDFTLNSVHLLCQRKHILFIFAWRVWSFIGQGWNGYRLQSSLVDHMVWTRAQWFPQYRQTSRLLHRFSSFDAHLLGSSCKYFFHALVL